LAQLRVIEQAIDELKSYIRRKMDEMKKTKQLLKPSAELNHRQIAILSHAIRHPGHEYTVQSHQNSQNVAYDTARTDLLDLVEKGLLDQMSSGRKFIFK